MVPQDAQQELINRSLNASSLLNDVGQCIKAERERCGLSAEVLAASLHMGVEQLRALEQGDLDALPEPVFIRAMVRRIASHLRLDADSLVRQLDPAKETAHSARASKPSPITIPSQASFAAANATARPRRHLLLIVPVALLFGGAGLTFLQKQLGPNPDRSLHQHAVILKQTPIPQELAPRPRSAQPATPATKDLVIEINSSEPSWIRLRRKGTIEFEGTLDGTRTIKDPGSVEILAGRPDLITIIKTGEKPQTLGKIDQVRWYQLDQP